MLTRTAHTGAQDAKRSKGLQEDCNESDTRGWTPQTCDRTQTHARQGKEMHGEATAPIPLTQRKATDATDPAQNEAMHEKPE